MTMPSLAVGDSLPTEGVDFGAKGKNKGKGKGKQGKGKGKNKGKTEESDPPIKTAIQEAKQASRLHVNYA